jgi:hypothetical protein
MVVSDCFVTTNLVALVVLTTSNMLVVGGTLVLEGRAERHHLLRFIVSRLEATAVPH